ncbi:hypothetical protein UA75_27895 [Actinoalloteichus sp. GBA129-24]|uniref:DUF5753 domain-containing protein n=2 Tax=Pseudonocardiaceae TaxID=2070 RepID=A0AAC9LGP0_9PSEU|nr:hypothetical protein UA74_27350 [Actinoalloteichus fjordicus]APU23550.1 hypothetical protein UA75_27895 [Actinoalloteichus sp. GBA129-24]
MVLDTSYGRVIHVEHHAASILLDKRKHTTAYGRVLEAVSGSALQPEESVDAIRRQLARWEQPS